MNKKVVYCVVLNEFAEWESSYVVQGLQYVFQEDLELHWVSLKKGCIKTITQMSVNITEDLSDMTDPTAVVLIGSSLWESEDTEELYEKVKECIDKKIILGAICGASEWLANTGLINSYQHTSNGLESITKWGTSKYDGHNNYVNEQAVVDEHIITANGTSSLEFTKELLLRLDPSKKEVIQSWYQFFKDGFYKKKD